MWPFKKQQESKSNDTPQPISAETLEEKNANYLAFRADEIKKLREYYDFNSIKGVRSIPVPCFEPNGKNSTTGTVEYYLRGKGYKEAVDAGNYELAIECLLKAHSLMFISEAIWKRDAFYSDINHIYELGYDDIAASEKTRVDEYLSHLEENVLNRYMKHLRDNMKAMDTDLVEVTWEPNCCAKCARYRGRIYSLSGKNKRLPKFPINFHLECGLHARAFNPKFSDPSFDCGGDYIKFSNRPFVDDRTQEQKEAYEARMLFLREQDKIIIRRQQNNVDYYWLKRNLPDLCPKSLSAYSRMKNSNSTTYQNIVKAALEMGRKL